MPEDLKVEEPNLVAGRPDRLSHTLQSQGLKPKVNLRVHERARVN
jgi:hypothetical protein